MKYYRMSSKNEWSSICIKTDVEYSYKKVYRNPESLINQVFKIYKGTRLKDLIDYCDPVNFAISENLKNVLEENDITGWATYPIKIENLEGNFYGFQVIGKGGEVTNRDRYGDVPMFKPVKWNMEKWDGSDIFNIEETLVTICTERVKEIVEKAKIINIIFEPF